MKTLERERAERGAALLDDHEPDWYTTINLDQLDLEDPCLCVLGQIQGDYATAVRALAKLDPWATAWDQCRAADQWGVEHGFEASTSLKTLRQLQDEWNLLQEAWLELIHERRDGAL